MIETLGGNRSKMTIKSNRARLAAFSDISLWIKNEVIKGKKNKTMNDRQYRECDGQQAYGEKDEAEHIWNRRSKKCRNKWKEVQRKNNINRNHIIHVINKHKDQ